MGGDLSSDESMEKSNTPDTPGEIRLKHLARINPTKSELSHLDPETKVSFVPLEDFGTDGEIKEREMRRLGDVYDGYTYFQEGDIAIAKITPSFENGKGAICRGLENDIGFGTTELHILRPRDGVSTEFLWYVLRSKRFMDEAETAMRGVAGQQRVPTEFLENFEVLIPSLDAQRKCVRYIKTIEAEIDRLVNALEQLLDLLDTKRIAEITRLVTTGTSDQNREMKEVESEWFDRVPVEWEIQRLNYLRDLSTTICYGIVLPGPDQEDGVPIIKGGDCHPDALNPETLSKTTPEKASDYQRSRLDAGDLVYEIRGSVGRVVKVPSELEGANLTQDTARISPRANVSSTWLKYALKSEPFRQQMDLQTHGATIQGVNLEDLRNGVLPVPPYEEQKSIASVATQTDERIRSLSEKIRREISLLSERKNALITKAVTGQIDLSDWQPPDKQEIPQ